MDELKNIAKETVDIKGVGFYSLGSIRKTLNDDQKKQYLLFGKGLDLDEINFLSNE